MTFRRDLDKIHRTLLGAFPPLSVRAQQASVALYRLLIEGRVVRRELLAATLDLSTSDIVAVLQEPGMRCEVLYDDVARVAGFRGLGGQTTPHRFEVNQRELFTWCAWDALFIPVLLDVSAQLTSTCPTTGKTIQVSVSRYGATSPGHPVLSFVEPSPDDCARSTRHSIDCFCSQVNLFRSAHAGAAWMAARTGPFLLSLEDAFRLGRRHVAARFGAVMSGEPLSRASIRS